MAGKGRSILLTLATFMAGLVTGRAIKRTIAERREEALRRQLAAAEQREDAQAKV
jgi:hypothetical protein